MVSRALAATTGRDRLANEPVVRIRNLSKTYPHHDRGRFTALDDVDLDIERGTVHGVAGFSGAGKSTLLRTINLLERPDAGSIFVNGEDLTTLPARVLRQRRRKLGMIFQEFNLLANRTVVVYKELSSTPSPSTDQKIGTDTTESDGSWSIGNSGFKHGSFYAKVKSTTDCSGAQSKVIVR